MWISNALLFVLLLTIPLGQFGVISFGSSFVNISLTDFAALLYVLVTTIFLLVQRSFVIPRSLWWGVLFIFVGSLSLIKATLYFLPTQVLIGSLYWARFMVYYFVSVVVYNHLRSVPIPEREKNVSRLLVIMLVVSFAVALTGFVQLAVFPDFTKLDPALGWDPHQNRLAGTFFDPNFTGAFLILGVVLSWQLIKARSFNGLGKWFVPVVGNTVLSAVILTFSRSAYIMLSVVVVLYSYIYSKKYFAIAIIIFIAAYLFVPRIQTRIAGGVDLDDSARERIVSWKQSARIISEHPFLGVGFNTYRYASAAQNYFDYHQPLGGRSGAGADSSLLFVWATTGIIGLSSYILLLLGILKRLLAITRSSCDLCRVCALAVVVSVVGLLVESWFINSLFYPWIMVWLWVMVGVTYGSAEK